MKRIASIAIVLTLLNIGLIWAVPNSFPISSDDEIFNNWTEDQYKHYEDSIMSRLYTPVIPQKADSISFGETANGHLQTLSLSSTNTHVPNSISLDQSKEVGEIVINSGTSPTGAKTYEIPINAYPGMNGFNPQLSLAYNSQQGNSVVGMGWSVAGVPMITRSGKTIYYDGQSQGIGMDNSDAFVLNGIRLIKKSAEGGYIFYESEYGNIKVKGKGSDTGNMMRYFEVYYPDGNKGIFGDTILIKNQLYYPLILLTDLNGNRINYKYTYLNNHWTISKITYNNDASVEFSYSSSRPDPILYFAGGYKVYESQLLQSITCKLGSTILGTYSLKYTTQDTKSLLTQIDYSASGKSYNPLLFYYGRGYVASGYIQSTTQLYEWYVADDPNMIKVTKGKFDYDSGADGLIALPNLNPYWKHHRNSTLIRNSQDRFDNLYTGDEKIFLYAGLKDSWAYPMPNLYTEKGFIDIYVLIWRGSKKNLLLKSTI